MARETALVKASGDLLNRVDFFAWLERIAVDYSVVILPGGGTQINEAFLARGFPIHFGPLGREMKTAKERELARDILEQNRGQVEDLLARHNVQAKVILPWLDIGLVSCPVNGDVFVLTAYLGFDKLYVCTLEERKEQKVKEYEKYPKIEVVGFPS